MNILLVASEISPFAKSGGLADVTGALPKQWSEMGHNPILVMPKYGFIDVNLWDLKPSLMTLNVPMGFTTEFAHFWQGKLPGTNVTVYFIEHNEYFDRPGIYGDPSEYFDNDRRFIFLSRAAFEIAKAVDFRPDVIHAHDFHTAFTMPFLKVYYSQEERFAKTAGVFTIHNLAYQGKFNPYRAMDMSGFGMKEFYPSSWFEHYGAVNSMKVGVCFADKVTTVSPTYAREISLHYYGEGLHDVINSRADDLEGILNGADYQVWNPENDLYIKHNYSIEKLDNKYLNKEAFLKDFGIYTEDNFKKPLVGMVGRLTEQKGIDLIKAKLDYYLGSNKICFALLGSGEPHYVDFFNYIKWKYKDSSIINIGYDEEYAHRLIAASDFFLVPSRFEPCGLTQMYSMRYGTLPIVRKTGGLADTVEEFDPTSGIGNGFTFLNYDSDDFAWALERALGLYPDKKLMKNAMTNAMKMNFSARISAKNYIDLFEKTLERFL